MADTKLRCDNEGLRLSASMFNLCVDKKDREAHFASRSFSIHYNERRKFKTSCFCDVARLLKLVMTASASETQVWRCSKGWKATPLMTNWSKSWLVKQLFGPPVWAAMACSRSVVRPSCRKNNLWPSPHSGAVRNSSGS